MPSIAVSVTDFARGLSDFLNQVQYRGQVLDVEQREAQRGAFVEYLIASIPILEFAIYAGLNVEKFSLE